MLIVQNAHCKWFMGLSIVVCEICRAESWGCPKAAESCQHGGRTRLLPCTLPAVLALPWADWATKAQLWSRKRVQHLPGGPLPTQCSCRLTFTEVLFWKSSCKAGFVFFCRAGGSGRRNSPKQNREEKKPLKRNQAVATGKRISLKTPQEVMLLSIFQLPPSEEARV